jgi:hypothetical protein
MMQKLTSTVTSLIEQLDAPGSIASTGPIFLMVPTNPVASFNSLMAATSGASFSSTGPVPIHSISKICINQRSAALNIFLSLEILSAIYTSHLQIANKRTRIAPTAVQLGTGQTGITLKSGYYRNFCFLSFFF